MKKGFDYNNVIYRVDGDIETYINLITAIFSQARHDWINGWNTIYRKMGRYYDDEIYSNDKKKLESLDKTDPEYRNLTKLITKYEKLEIKNLLTVKSFLKSKWCESLCTCCNVEIDAVIDEFDRLRRITFDKIKNN